jgi:hypothetical protein
MPRPDATSGFITALQAQYIQPAIFVQVQFITGVVYVWTGTGSITWGGHTWLGVGTFGGISAVEEGTNIQARGITLSLTGFDATLLTEVLTDYRQGLPAAVYFGLFDGTGTLIPDPITSWSGRTDQPTISVDGDTASISINCESRLLDMNIEQNFRYNDQTQKMFYPGDRGFEFTNSIQDITLYWGRHPSNSNNWSVQGTSAG